MHVEQRRWGGRWLPAPPSLSGAQLVLVFADRHALEGGAALRAVREAYPSALVVGASTAGEIAGLDVLEGSVVVTALRFERTRVAVSHVDIEDAGGSIEAGTFLARGIPHEGLAHALVFADGIVVNGTDLVRGLRNELPPMVQVTGGLAGDGERFQRTLVVADGVARPRQACLVGLYGPHVRASYGSLGGWDPFGPSRTITRSEGNVLLELDGRPALDVYKEVLGDKADGLPATGLLFPLLVTTAANEFVRTLLQVDPARGALVFAGDVPQGTRARFMRANFERLIQGAAGAALDARPDDAPGDQLAILVSCVGRRMVLKERTADEVAAVSKVLGERATLAGFYSYGEICPVARDANCTLHNQTMTVTVLAEERAMDAAGRGG